MMLNNFFGQIDHIVFGGRERRRKRRYSVNWDAELDVRFPAFEGTVPVTLTDFSELGARFYSNRVFLENHHLISIQEQPDLFLKILLPEGLFMACVQIVWYQWVAAKNLYEIAVEFTGIFEESKNMVEQVICRLSQKGR